MKATDHGEAITQLAWLCPSAGSLLALARSAPPHAWTIMRNDPGSVLLVVRHGLEQNANPQQISFPSLLTNERVCQAAADGLETAGCEYADWNGASLKSILSACRQYARGSFKIAQLSGKCSEELAWLSGLLAPVGWLGACALEPDRVAACFSDPEWKRRPSEVQEKLFGSDLAGLARRLNRRWRLPSWLAAITGNLGLSSEVASRLGADLALFQTVQLAVLLCQEQGEGLALSIGDQARNLAHALGISSEGLAHIRTEITQSEGGCKEPEEWTSPYKAPLLSDLLTLAAENRRLAKEPMLQRLEGDVDALQRALETIKAGEADRLQSQKLTAL
ncbi:MAG TPA: HDOD domain-containing protein, partial [Gemmataceae bacterium]|nr:HDOD domain-containing protein [Gemmataceae bacterium]